MLRWNPGCVYVCDCVCVCVCVFVCGSAAAQTEQSILTKLSTNNLTDICEVRFLSVFEISKSTISWRPFFIFFQSRSLTVAILLRFSSNIAQKVESYLPMFDIENQLDWFVTYANMADHVKEKNSKSPPIFIFSQFDWICCDGTEGVCMCVCVYVCACVTALQPKRMDGFWWNFLQMFWSIFVRFVFLGFWKFEIDDVMAPILYVFC